MDVICLYNTRKQKSPPQHGLQLPMGVLQRSLDVSNVVVFNLAGSLRRLTNNAVSPTGENATVHRYLSLRRKYNITLTVTQWRFLNFPHRLLRQWYGPSLPILSSCRRCCISTGHIPLHSQRLQRSKRRSRYRPVYRGSNPPLKQSNISEQRQWCVGWNITHLIWMISCL